ncbi:MAG: hypothetical protein EAX96_20795 [Candidatus Lokiarchaeota archaeon]|nr:hypothetical protein [Candidatus Lokiarchaeota archaeon]
MKESEEISNKKIAQVEALLKQKARIDKRLDKLLCKQCGECCHRTRWINENTLLIQNEYCDQLDWKEGKAFCKLYPNHHGYEIGEFETCVSIKDVANRANDCQYNLFYPLIPAKYNIIKEWELPVRIIKNIVELFSCSIRIIDDPCFGSGLIGLDEGL